MRSRNLFDLVNYALLSIFLTLSALCISSCSSDNDEPEIPPTAADKDGQDTSSNANNSVVINSDGTSSNGAVFARLNDNTFFLDYVKYKIVDAHLEIISYDKQELPDEPKLYAEVTLDGTLYKTRSINEGAFAGANLKSIVIPATVTMINHACFAGCTALTSVKLPDGLTRLGNHWNHANEYNSGCFSGCTSLTSITLPAGLTNIEDNCFARCTSLKSVNVDERQTPTGTVTDIQLLWDSVGTHCFVGCTSLTSVILPDGISELMRYCFKDCSSLTSITLPKELRTIDSCFEKCTALSKITFKSDVGDYYNLNKITSKPVAYVPTQFLENYKEHFAECFSEIIGY